MGPVRTRAGVCAVAAALLLTVSACGDEAAEPTPSPTQASPEETAEAMDPAEAEKAEAVLDEFLGGIDGVETLAVDGTIESKDAGQSFDFDVDRASGSFAGDITTREGEAEEKTQLIRTSNLTWMKASDEFWAAQGFDEDSVKRARGKWVVFTKDIGDDIADQYNLGAVFDSLTKIRSAEAKGTVDLDGEPAYRFDYTQSGTTMSVDIPESTDKVRLTSTVDGSESVFVMSDFGKSVDIAVPDPDEVMQPVD